METLNKNKLHFFSGEGGQHSEFDDLSREVYGIGHVQQFFAVN